MKISFVSKLDPAAQRELMFWLLIAILFSVVFFGVVLVLFEWRSFLLKRKEVELKVKTLKKAEEQLELSSKYLAISQKWNENTARGAVELVTQAKSVREAANQVKDVIAQAGGDSQTLRAQP